MDDLIYHWLTPVAIRPSPLRGEDFDVPESLSGTLTARSTAAACENDGMSDEPKKGSRRWIVSALVAVFVLYPLSVGPVKLIGWELDGCHRGAWTRFLEGAYWPITECRPSNRPALASQPLRRRVVEHGPNSLLISHHKPLCYLAEKFWQKASLPPFDSPERLCHSGTMEHLLNLSCRAAANWPPRVRTFRRGR